MGVTPEGIRTESLKAFSLCRSRVYQAGRFGADFSTTLGVSGTTLAEDSNDPELRSLDPNLRLSLANAPPTS